MSKPLQSVGLLRVCVEEENGIKVVGEAFHPRHLSD